MLKYSDLMTYKGRSFFNLISIPEYFDILFDNIFVWDFHDKFSSMMTPRFWHSETRSISMPLISRVGINPVMSFWVGWKTMNLVFVIFSVSLFSVNQLCTSESSLFSVSFTFVLVMGIEYSIVLNRSVSSANSINSKTSLAFGRSFI